MPAPRTLPSERSLPGRLARRPPWAWVRAGLVAVNLAAVVFYLLSFRHGIGFGPYREDLAVYRMGGRVWLRGGFLYRQPRRPGGHLRLPFTYPPVAAVLFSLASLAPALAAVVADTLAAVALLGAVLRIFLRRLAGRAGASMWALAWLMPAALFIEPVRSELSLGQINIALMALVTADCLAGFPGRSRGALTGLAAAIKLTPLAFVLFFLLRRDYRAAATAVLSFAAVTGVGFALAWHDSVRYWTAVIFQASRVGGLAYAGNQSILGALARSGLDPATMTGLAVWLGLCLAVLAVRRRHAARARGFGGRLGAVAERARQPAGLADLLVAPLGCGSRPRC
ncbi:MAG: glycosyltransferase 87 family protein [Streptosporangiaceae bacterium]